VSLRKPWLMQALSTDARAWIPFPHSPLYNVPLAGGPTSVASYPSLRAHLRSQKMGLVSLLDYPQPSLHYRLGKRERERKGVPALGYIMQHMTITTHVSLYS
jgi:hypothetical protein